MIKNKCKLSGLAIYFTLLTFSGYTQPQPYDQYKVDSLNKLIAATHADTNKVKSLIFLAQMYMANGNTELLLKYITEAESISKKLNYNEGIISSKFQKAFYYSTTGDWPKGILGVNELIPLLEKYSKKDLIGAYNLMFINTATQGHLDEAKMWVLKALNSPEFPNLPDMTKWPTYMQAGLSYEFINNLDSAQYFANMLQGFLKKYHHQDLENNSYNLLGSIARKKKQYDIAKEFYNKAVPVDHLGLAWVYDELKKPDSVIYHAKVALSDGEKVHDPRKILESSKLLAKYYADQNPALSNKYLQLYSDTKDTLFNANKLKQLEEIGLTEQRKAYESQQEKALYRNRLIQFGLVGLALLFLFATLIFYFNNRFKKRANEKLEEKNLELGIEKQKLETTLSELRSTQQQLIHTEKMASLGGLTAGIAHEIQNPLNFVNNFSEINKELIGEMQAELKAGKIQDAIEIANDIKENEEKINHHGKRADAIVKGMLQHSRSSSGVKEPANINALADEYLRLAYHGLRAKDKTFNATIKTDFDETIGDINIIPQDIGRVILNLITNAFYAVNEKKNSGVENYEPTVEVRTKSIKPPSGGLGVSIAVTDNGNGIPQKILEKIFQPFFTTKPTGQGTGLGLSLAYDIVKVHGGEIKVETKEGEGTTFIIQLPVA
ncbi:MAG: hypothetical protein JSS70_10870 [Bacteroidetes bacterium]|nr:hypothetical protein [Bacteroidota bacterium]